MAPTKTAGGQGPSDKFLKKDAAGNATQPTHPRQHLTKNGKSTAKGLGADNAPAHKEATAPGEAPVASDSGLAIDEHPAEEAAAGTGNLTAHSEAVGTDGLTRARPGGAAKGPNLAGPA